MTRRRIFPDETLTSFHIKMSKTDLDRLKEFAKKSGKGHTSLAREIIREKILNAA